MRMLILIFLVLFGLSIKKKLLIAKLAISNYNLVCVQYVQMPL